MFQAHHKDLRRALHTDQQRDNCATEEFDLSTESVLALSLFRPPFDSQLETEHFRNENLTG